VNTPDESLRRQLEALPDPVLPEALWTSFQASHRARVHRRRLGLAASVAAVGLLALLPVLQRDAERDVSVVHDTAPVAAPGSRDKDASAPLWVVDAAIQNAYDEGASDDEIQPLWEARQRLMTLQSRQRGPATAPPHS
jgi:hypothetical protein